MKTKFILLIAISLFLFSCGGKDFSVQSDNKITNDESSYASLPTKIKSGGGGGGTTTGTKKTSETEETVIEKKIIKTAEIRYGVSDYKKSKLNIEKIVKKNKGYVSSENESNNSYSISNTLIIRVPKENFDSLLTALEGEAQKFESKSISSQDVTEEYVDILKRLENKKKVEAQYIELLKKAKKISEILEVNEHIRKLREEIEAKEGRLRYLKSQVGFSTITLNIHQDFDTVSYGFLHKIGNALEGGWKGLLMFFIGLLYIWPLLLVFGFIFFLIKRFIRKSKLKKQKIKN